MKSTTAPWIAFVSLLAIASAWSAPAHSQDAASAGSPAPSAWAVPANDVIGALLRELMQRNGIGIVVGVIEPGGRRVVVHGRSGAPDGRALDGDTVFQIGSVTKVFTGLLLADMVQRGEVEVDDPVSKYLPSAVRMPQRGRPITLLDLSKHCSALPSMPTNFSLQANPDPYAAYSVEQLYEFLSSYELPREPGRQEYSNLGVALLGRLLANHAGMEYEPFLKQRVLKPLGLMSTSITLTRSQVSRLARGHDRFIQPVDTWEMRVMPASGSLRSTANDLLRFLAFNLGMQDSALYPAMEYQRTPMRALGWGRSMLGGEAVYSHDGGKAGYRAAVIFNPNRKTGVVVLTNARTDDRPMVLARHLLYAQSPPPPASTAPMRPKVAKLKTQTLDAYAGLYRLVPSGILTVARRRDYLLVDSNGEGISTFYPASEREFFSNTEDQSIVFEIDAAGRATGLVLRTGEATERAVRVDPTR